VPSTLALASSVLATALDIEPGMWQCAPTTDPISLVLGAYVATRESKGSLLVLVPTESWATRLRGRLEQRGIAVASGESEWNRMRAGWPVVVGSRGAALAPVPTLSGAVIIDADDEAFRSEATPTWDALTMLRERCQRDKAPLWATSVVPSPSMINGGTLHVAADIASGWPRVVVVDRRHSDPRDGVLSREALDLAHQALSSDEPVAVVVVLQRLGSGRLFACRACGELARCAQCGQPEEEVGDALSCRERHVLRANFCTSCGATNLRKVRVGVSSMAKDVSAQLSQPVSEITAQSDASIPMSRVVVGSEAVWQRVRRCGVVIFVDFDQYLLAPRASARRAAITAVGKAGRLVGARNKDGGAVVVQTRRGEDAVIAALRSGDFRDVMREDDETAKLLGLPPYGALAHVSGEGAANFVAQIVHSPVRAYPNEEGFELRASTLLDLTTTLRRLERPAGRLRVAIE
jgi:primosomal protein N' (replication factor Y)